LYLKTVKSVGLVEEKLGEVNTLDSQHHLITDKEEKVKQTNTPDIHKYDVVDSDKK
jgi:hypothetical protein